MLFRSKKKQSPKAKAGAADTLICKKTKIAGDIDFTGVLYVDGHVQGNITSEEVDNSLLTIGKNGLIEGEIQVPHIVVLGRVKGDVHALEHVELMSEARIEGNVYYKLIEMAMGAEVNGQMLRRQEKQKLISHHKAMGEVVEPQNDSVDQNHLNPEFINDDGINRNDVSHDEEIQNFEEEINEQ